MELGPRVKHELAEDVPPQGAGSQKVAPRRRCGLDGLIKGKARHRAVGSGVSDGTDEDRMYNDHEDIPQDDAEAHQAYPVLLK